MILYHIAAARWNADWTCFQARYLEIMTFKKTRKYKNIRTKKLYMFIVESLQDDMVSFKL